jgi:hypothetical protein
MASHKYTQISTHLIHHTEFASRLFPVSTMTSAKVCIALLAAVILGGCLQGETDEEREAARKGRIECSDPLIIPGPTSEPSAAPYPPC